jgi:hypothetical protein
MMSVPPAPAETSPAGASAADSDCRGPSLLHQAEAVWRELPGLFNDRVELFELELKRAAQAATRMAGLLALAALLAMTAWALLWAVFVSALAALGVPLWSALAIALAVNLAGAVVAAMRVRPLLKTLGMPATRRHLTFAPSDAGVREPPRERSAQARSGVSQDKHKHDQAHPSAASASAR